jgi:hypothetical protein
MVEKKAPRADLGRTLEALVAHAPDRTTWKAITAELDRIPATIAANLDGPAPAALVSPSCRDERDAAG